MAFTLKVSPDELKAAANKINSEIADLKAGWGQLAQTVLHAKGYWSGEAGYAHQKQFQQYGQDVERIIARLRKHPDDLMAMAGLYEATETEAAEKTQELTGNVIF